VAAAYHRVTADHPGRFLIGVANPIADHGGRVDADRDTLLIALYMELDDYIIPAYWASAGPCCS
jgi:hypothetical protein